MIRTFTAADIEKYHAGQLSAREMHALEKAALDDPFLADALEGYATPGVNVAADIAELKKRLEEREKKNRIIPITSGRTSSFRWLRVAALIVLVAGTGFFIYKLSFTSKREQDIAQAPLPDSNKSTPPTATTPADSAKTIQPGAYNNVTDTVKALNRQFLDFKADSASAYKWQGESNLTTIKADSLTNYYTTLTPSANEKNPVETTTPKLKDNFFELKQQAPVAQHKGADVTTNNNFGITTQTSLDSVAIASNGYMGDIAANRKNNANTPIRTRGYDYRNNANSPVTNNAITNNQLYNNRTNVFRGQVTDLNNNPVPFANITNTADNVGTYGDVNGNFTLISPDSVLNVQVRSIGYESNVLQLQSQQRDNRIKMKEEDNSFAEVVVSNKRVRNTKSRTNGTTLEEPEPVDGWNNYDTYLANNLNMPDTLKALKATASREVQLSFDVNKDGEPVNISVDKSLCKSCDEEAIRVVKEGPKWKRKKKKRTSVTISF